MRTPNEQVILDGLLHIRRCVDRGTTDKNCGICDSLKRYISFMDDEKLEAEVIPTIPDILEKLFTTWPKYSGDHEYPITEEDIHPEISYLHVLDLWDTSHQYGRDRVELLDFLIKELQNEQI